MRLFSRDAFMALPAGVIFAKGTPCAFGDIAVKGDTIVSDGRAIDFAVLHLVGIDSFDTGEMIERYTRMEEFGEGFPCNEDYGRDGCFDSDAWFLVWEDDDLRKLSKIVDSARDAELPPRTSLHSPE